jgi:16S rRNA (cytosine967-C5)-methyltransferase
VAIHPWPPPPQLTATCVLVDAPCSELGALRRGPDLRWRLDPASFDRWPPIQRALLERGAAHLAPHGRLVYATCTLRAAENDAVVDAFLSRHPDFTLVRPTLADTLLDARGFLRTFPHRHGTDGFFGAVLVRGG